MLKSAHKAAMESKKERDEEREVEDVVSPEREQAKALDFGDMDVDGRKYEDEDAEGEEEDEEVQVEVRIIASPY